SDRDWSSDVCSSDLAMKFIQVFVHDQSDEEVTARFFLLLAGKTVKRLRQHLVSRAVADLVDEITFRPRDGPGFSDGGAALGYDEIGRASCRERVVG